MATIDGLKFDSKPLRRAFLCWGKGYQQLAKTVHCSLDSAHGVINGESPTSKFLPKICKLLGVDLSDCWSDDDAVGGVANK